jgi:hypothetical protein
LGLTQKSRGCFEDRRVLGKILASEVGAYRPAGIGNPLKNTFDMKSWRQATPDQALRMALLFILLIGMIGSGTELILLNHVEERLQWLPLVLIALGVSASMWHAFRATATSVRALQAIFLAFVLAGVAGMYFHYQGAVEFKLESKPSLKGWELFRQAIFSKAPPLLAPGAMIQLGLLGLIYAYRHPATTKTSGENVKSTEGD